MGLEILLRAFRLLAREVPDLHLAIGGSGPLEGMLRALRGSLGLSDRVRFLGYVPEAALPGLYAAADLFVLPTEQLEGFGLVTVEALACGTPVVGTPVGATRRASLGIDPRWWPPDVAHRWPPPPPNLRSPRAAGSRPDAARGACMIRRRWDGWKPDRLFTTRSPAGRPPAGCRARGALSAVKSFHLGV
jgi:glycosyltransferase involved in cell wall biosynthesis